MDPTRMTDEQLTAEEEARLAELSASLWAFLTEQSLEHVIRRHEPLLIARLMSALQYGRRDLTPNERERLSNLLPELETLSARYPPER